MHVVKNSIIYLGSSILNKLIPFLLLPIMTQYLSPQEYGALSIYMILITLYGAFIGMNIHINVSKNFFAVPKEEMAVYIGNMLFILLTSFIIYFFITFIGIRFFDTIFSIEADWLLVIPIISMMMMVNNINISILRNEGKAYTYGIFEISNTIINMSTTILFLVFFSFGWHSQVIGIITGYFIFFIIGIIYMYQRDYINFKIDTSKIKSILNISLPLIPHVLGAVVITMSDRIFIEQMVSLEAVGIYSVGYMFGMVVMLFTDAFIKAWSPWFFKSLAEPTDSRKQKIVKYTYIYIVGVFILALFISIIGETTLPYFVDEKFYGASEYILWISLGYAVHGVYKIFFPYLVHISKTSFLAFSTVVAAILNLLFNYILIKYFGTIGAAYATILAFFVSAALVFWYQNMNFHMPWLK